MRLSLIVSVLESSNPPNYEYKKIIVDTYKSFKVVYIDKTKTPNQRIVKAFNILDTLRLGIEYKDISPTPMSKMRKYDTTLFPNPTIEHEIEVTLFSPYRFSFGSAWANQERNRVPPIIVHTSDETATDEPATETITFPFNEEPIWLFQDFAFRRLYPITQTFLQGLNAERVALLTKVDQLAGGVGDDEDHRRYDHAANLGRGLIGYTWEQINILSDDTLPAAKKKTRAEITSLIEKLEATFPDREAIDKFFVRHDEVNWQSVRQNRQIRLIGDDYRPGEELRNINAEHIKTKDGVTAVDQVSAENEYARCVKQCFRSAWADRRDTPRHTIQYSYGVGDSVATVPKSQLTDKSTLGDRPPEY